MRARIYQPARTAMQSGTAKTKGWVLVFALAAVAGLLTSLFIPRRRVWISVRSQADGTHVEYAALARGDDPTLSAALARIAHAHGRNLGLERD